MIMLAQEGDGFADIMGRYVCAACFEDAALRGFVNEHRSRRRCDYCGEESIDPSAAPLDEVVRHIRVSIEQEWVDADGALPRDPDTGEFMLETTIQTAELLAYEIELELPRDDGALRDAIVRALPNRAWCRDDPLVSTPDEAISNSWRAFRHIIRHRRRFFFMQHDDESLARDIDQAEAAYTIPGLLEALVSYADRTGLFVKVGAGESYVRAQAKDDDAAAAFPPERMASPPLSLAVQANRMSPPGISMFYGAETAETALAEIATASGRFAAGDFRLLRDAVLLDLREVPTPPSLFDLKHSNDRPFAIFMREFVEDFRKPVSDGDRKHVDYVPTQVVTEYVRSVARSEGAAIDGILYASTKADGATAVVLFADNAAVARTVPLDPWVVDGEDPWLEMVGYREGEFDPATRIFSQES